MKKTLLFFATITLMFGYILAQPTQQLQKVVPYGGTADDYFGKSVGLSGNYAIIGATGDETNDTLSGAAYIYHKNANNLWEQVDKLLPNDGNAEDEFGFSANIYGNYTIIGAPKNDDNGNESGSAYIFYNNSGNWVQTSKLTASDAASNDYFGYSVSIYNDYAVVGALYANANEGKAYVYHNNGGVWSEQAILTASDGGNRFGYSVNIFENYIIVGSMSSDAAYIFYNDGTSWTEIAKLVPPDSSSGIWFGYSVAISNNYAIVGAAGDDIGSLFNAGSVYIYENTGTDWSFVEKKLASDISSSDYFGASLSLSDEYLLVGAIYANGNTSSTGSAYLFQHTDTGWTEIIKLSSSDGNQSDYCGRALAMDGGNAILGAYGNDNSNGTDAGAAYFFTSQPPIITEQPNNNINICPNDTVHFHIAGTNIDSYQWQVNDGSGFINITNNSIYTGADTNNLTINGISLNMNGYEYRCIVSNVSGNIISNTVVLITDTTAPVIPTLPDIGGECEVSIITLPTAIDNCSGTIIGETTDPLYYNTQGNYVIHWTFDDGNGNIAYATQTIIVQDTTAPIIYFCPDNQFVNIENGDTIYTIQNTDFDPIAVDNCEIASITNNINDNTSISGVSLPIGTTNVEWTITDIAGNTSECTYTIEVTEQNDVKTLQSAGISLYPNPTNGIITFDFGKNKVEKLHLSNLTGKTIVEKTNLNKKERLDITNLANGIYIVKIQTATQTFTTKIVKK